MKTKFNVKKIALIGMLGAIGGILMFLKTPLPFMPPFMDFDFASLPEIIGGFALGPMAAVFIIIVKLIVKLATLGTSTMFTGEISNFLVSCAYVLPAVWIYNRQKTKKSALEGLLVGVFTCAGVAIITNVTIIFPFYAKLYDLPLSDIIKMCAAVNPLVTNMFSLVMFSILPFNLIKYGASSIVTYIVYKKLSVPLKKLIQ